VRAHRPDQIQLVLNRFWRRQPRGDDLEPSARTPKRHERVAALKEAAETNQVLLKEILRRYKLEE
jgi:hypothetical protein